MKTENIRLGFGALGCALKFRKGEIQRFDGSLEYWKMLYMLVRNEAVSHVLLLQKSDWNELTDIEKIEFDPRGVLLDPYSDLDDFNRQSVGIKKNEDTQLCLSYRNLWERFKNEEPLDAIIHFIGMGYYTNNSIPNFLDAVRIPGHRTRVQWVTYNYCAPPIHYINESKIPWYMIACDPRYVKESMRMRDTFWAPKEVISQFEQKLIWDSVEKYEGNEGTCGNEIQKETWLRATGIEKLARINEPIFPPDNDRPIKFMMVAMQSKYGQGEGHDERLEMLKNWVFKYDPDKEVHVYGKWSPDVIKGYEDWFKGFIHHSEVDNKMLQTRYTLIRGIRAGWSTGKWADVLACGCLPFMAPDYDTQYSIVPKDHFFRVKTPDEMHKKIAFLEANPDKRIALIKKNQYELLKDAKSGKFVYDILNKSFERTGVGIRLSMNKDETILRKQRSKSLF